VEAVSILVHVRADVDAATVAAVTPLYMACAAGSAGSAALLRAAGARLRIADVAAGAYEGHRTILDVDVLGRVPRVRRAVDDQRANLGRYEAHAVNATGVVARPDLAQLHNLNPR
jgi:hypothetical protein